MNKLLNVFGALLILGTGNMVAQTTSATTFFLNPPSGVGAGQFTNGNGDAANFSIVDNEIDSWWGLGIKGMCCNSYNGYGIVFDARSGSMYTQGNVGIGTATPNAILSLEKEGISPSTYDMVRFNSGYGPIQWGITGNTANAWGTTFYSWQPDSSNNGANLAFATGYGTTVNPNNSIRMLITANGNIGIGTTTPQAQLDVNGSVKLSGSITFPDGVQTEPWNGTTLGGDYAEAIDVLGDRAGYEPGDVIVINAASPGRFEKSSKAYSKLVAGVYSTKPGLVGRRLTFERVNKAAEVPMAMLGIVPTKVTTENGTIEPGDLLVTASKAGYAMKGTNKSRLTGAVLGKALAPLNSGDGVIEVMMSIQ